MAGTLWQRARFMGRLVFIVAKRALPRPAPKPAAPKPAAPKPAAIEDPEPLIEALQSGNLPALEGFGPTLTQGKDSRGNPWFFLALDIGSLTAVDWFLRHRARATAPDMAGRLPLEAVIQRAASADEFDDHLADLPAMATALIRAGANPQAHTVQGQSLADLARAAGLPLSQ